MMYFVPVLACTFDEMAVLRDLSRTTTAQSGRHGRAIQKNEQNEQQGYVGRSL